MYKNLQLRIEDPDVEQGLKKCYYLSKPIIRALGDRILEALNMFNHNIVFMLQQHEPHFNRLTPEMIINDTKWVYQNFNIFPNERFFNRMALNTTIPCYSIDTSFINMETFHKDLTKTLVSCNVIEGYVDDPDRTIQVLTTSKSDLKFINYDIDKYYELLGQIKDLKVQKFISEVLGFIKQNKARQDDIFDIIKKISILDE